MSVRASVWAWQQMQGNDLTDGERLVLLALADTADPDGICWPSVSTVAAKLDRSTKTIRKRVSDLEDKGYLERSQRRRENGSMTSNLYRLMMPPESREAPPKTPMKDWRLYFLLVGNRVKIGISANVAKRVATLATANADEVKLLGDVKGSRAAEQAVHDKLRPHRERGEWFHWNAEVRAEVEKLLQTADGTPPADGNTGSGPELPGVSSGSTGENSSTKDENEIYNYWVKKTGRDSARTKFTPERRKKVRTRLREGYTVERIKTAIDHVAESDFHVKGGHTELTMICRSPEKLDYYEALRPNDRRTFADERRTDPSNAPW